MKLTEIKGESNFHTFPATILSDCNTFLLYWFPDGGEMKELDSAPNLIKNR